MAIRAESNISVTDDIQLQNLLMTTGCSAIYWKDGGGSLTFVSDAANPTNYITPFKDGQHYELQVPVNCAGTLVKGVRGVADFDYESQLAAIMRSFDSRLETVLLPARAEYAHISSTYARELIRYDCDLERGVPSSVIAKIRELTK